MEACLNWADFGRDSSSLLAGWRECAKYTTGFYRKSW